MKYIYFVMQWNTSLVILKNFKNDLLVCFREWNVLVADLLKKTYPLINKDYF